jgi:hypothetical protein
MSNIEKTWRWSVEGTQDKLHGSTMERPFSDEDTIEAECGGEVLDWLVREGPIWDGLDQHKEFTITIAPERNQETDE